MPGVNLAVVPARGGSKRLQSKNLALLGGKTLLARAVAVGLDSGCEVLVTSDCPSTLAQAVDCGALIHERNGKLSTGYKYSILDVWLDALEAFERKTGKVVNKSVLLEPTSPFRTKEDVLHCLSHDHHCATVVDLKLDPISGITYPLFNGICWMAPRDIVINKTLYKDLHYISSRKTVNIDYPIDLEFARFLYEKEN